jgi:hypothetical protein
LYINNWIYELQKNNYTSNFLISKLDAGLFDGKITHWNNHKLTDTGYTIKQWVKNFLNEKILENNIPIYWSSQFGVNKNVILKNSKNLYENLLNQHTTTHTELSHFMERAWCLIFKINNNNYGKIILSKENNEIINFNFRRPSNEIPDGMFELSINHETSLFLDEKQFPLTLLHKSLKGKVTSKTVMFPGWYSHYPNNSYTTVELVDFIGNKLFEWKWNVFIHGNFGHQFFENWANMNKGSNGIAIGTNDGMSGEWVGPVINGKLNATLVEASKKQYDELNDFYGEYPWVTLKNDLITANGGLQTFYEGGDGVTNSCNKNVILKYVINYNVSEIKIDSISINDLIVEVSTKGKVKWLHLDVEGIDGELIYSIKDNLLPEVIIFESVHMSSEYKFNLLDFLSKKGFNSVTSGYNTICFKK